jgi:hypothetical protein
MHVHCTICLCGEWEVGECRRNWWNFYNRHQSKMFSLKIFPCKETLRQMFFIVYRLEIQSVMLVFSTHLYELLPLSPSLWFNSSPYPFLNNYTVHMYTVYKRGYGVLGLRQINTCRNSLYRSIFRDDDI